MDGRVWVRMEGRACDEGGGRRGSNDDMLVRTLVQKMLHIQLSKGGREWCGELLKSSSIGSKGAMKRNTLNTQVAPSWLSNVYSCISLKNIPREQTTEEEIFYVVFVAWHHLDTVRKYIRKYVISRTSSERNV